MKKKGINQTQNFKKKNPTDTFTFKLSLGREIA